MSTLVQNVALAKTPLSSAIPSSCRYSMDLPNNQELLQNSKHLKTLPQVEATAEIDHMGKKEQDAYRGMLLTPAPSKTYHIQSKQPSCPNVRPC